LGDSKQLAAGAIRLVSNTLRQRARLPNHRPECNTAPRFDSRLDDLESVMLVEAHALRMADWSSSLARPASAKRAGRLRRRTRRTASGRSGAGATQTRRATRSDRGDRSSGSSRTRTPTFSEVHPLPTTSKAEAPIALDEPVIEDRYVELDGYTVAYETHKADMDPAPLFHGLPDDRCRCPHWGVVNRGKIIFRYADHEEVFQAGDAYYGRRAICR
jgi:hypothetical protein